jgi:signal transduction histidine kinase
MLDDRFTQAERVDRLNHDAWGLRTSDPQEAIRIADSARKTSEQIDYLPGLCKSLHILAHCHYRIGDHQQALDLCSSSINMAESIGDRNVQADALNTQGNVHSALGDHHSAFAFYLKSLALNQALGNRQAEAALWNNIGNVNFHLEDYPNALEAHQTSLAIKQSLDDKNGVAVSLHNIGNVYKHTAEFDNALNHYSLSLKLSQELHNLYGEAGTLGNIGSIYAELGNASAAREHQMRSLALEREIGNRHGESESLLQIGELYLKHPEIAGSEDALDYLRGSLRVAEEIDAKELRFRAHRALSNLFEARGDFRNALSNFRRSYELEREIFNEQLSEKTRNLQIIHKVELARLRNVELEEANRFKTRLLSIAAHDLRSPLQGISGFADLLVGRLPPDSSLHQFAEQISLSANQMERLLNQLLETSKIDTGHMILDLQTIDIGRVAQQVAAINDQRARKKQQELIVNVSPRSFARADEVRMRQILENLVGNAIKFSPAGKRIWITVNRRPGKIRCSG